MNGTINLIKKVEMNVLASKLRKANAECTESLEKIKSCIDRLPNAWNSSIGENYVTLANTLVTAIEKKHTAFEKYADLMETTVKLFESE